MLNKIRSIFNPVKTEKNLNAGIARFYDEFTAMWMDFVGEHIHLGYYPTPDSKIHINAAQIDLIDRSLAWAYGDQLEKEMGNVKSLIDVGCGVGGSSRHIVKKYGKSSNLNGVGITLSPYQIKVANELTKVANLSTVLTYKVEDAMNTSFPDNKFDLVWSMESAEHMPDKFKFMNELVRLTAPGGRILVVTWCHREFAIGENSLKLEELKLLEEIEAAHYLPKFVPGSDHVRNAKSLGLEDVRQVDWTKFVAPFFPALLSIVFQPRNLLRMMLTSTIVLKAAYAGLALKKGYATGLCTLVLITGKKPK